MITRGMNWIIWNSVRAAADNNMPKVNAVAASSMVITSSQTKEPASIISSKNTDIEVIRTTCTAITTKNART